MQVNMHGMSKAEAIDFPECEAGPFTIVRISDDKGNTVDLFIRGQEAIQMLAGAVLDAARCLRAREIVAYSPVG